MIKLVKVDKIKRTRRSNNNRLIPIVEEFIRSNNENSEIIFTKDDYETAKYCYAAFYRVVRNMNVGVRVVVVGDHVYLTKVDGCPYKQN